MRNARLEKAQAGIKIAGRNINNLRHADDTTLMAESEEELKSLLMKMKEESEKVGLKLNIQNYLKGLLKYPSYLSVKWNFLYILPLKHIIHRLNSEVGMRIQIFASQ